MIYIFTFTFSKKWTLGLYFHFYFLQELNTCFIFSLLLSTRTEHLVYIITFTFYMNWRPKREKMTSVFDFTCFARPETREEYCTVELLSREVFTAIPVNDMLLRTKKTVLICAVHKEVFWLIKHYRQHWQQLFQGHPPKNMSVI